MFIFVAGYFSLFLFVAGYFGCSRSDGGSSFLFHLQFQFRLFGGSEQACCCHYGDGPAGG